jgi:3-hydroxyacyl-CoA dehydrogenase/enoyl-CoA hydratase/3-hydroxybutyryl-CoA epimerase
MATKKEYQNWQSHLEDKGVLWLGIDRHNSSVNSLNKEVLQELDAILDEIITDTSISSVIIYSKKKTGFIAGADISQFTEIKTTQDAFNLIRQGQLVFDKLAALPKPTVAMIEGFCLGGGLELALACRYRVAEDSHGTRLGLPEVHLGLQPGWGGSIRLPLLIGGPKAMRLIATGKILSAKEAAKFGFVDAAVPRRVLEKAAMYYAVEHPKPHKPTLFESLSNKSLARPFLGRMFESKLKERIREEHYPAPFAVIKNWVKYGPRHPEAMLREAQSISDLMMHPTGRNLLRVFFLKERLKGLAKGLTFKPEHVHVIGAGTMGSAIAAWCALSGFTVTLQDQAPNFIAPGLKKAHDIIERKLKSPREVMLVMDRLKADGEGLGVRQADVVIEAIIENLEAKHHLYQEIEPQMKSTALLATNTSSLPLNELAKCLKRPEQLVGIHFFNPVELMELVEVVSDAQTSQAKVNDALAFVKRINRLPLPVQSSPGFLVNRILMPYLLESMVLLEEGVPALVIDQAAKDFGMPMGPIELADKVGLDVCLSVADILTQHLGGEVPAQLRERVAEGKLGVKTNAGFYRYSKGKRLEPNKTPKTPPSISKEDIEDRLILRMLNESAACLRESIVSDADLLDAGMIFGTGFAPFRGGPMNYAKSRGTDAIRQRLIQLSEKFGPRFNPDSSWETEAVKPEIELPEVAMPRPSQSALHEESNNLH